MKPKPRTSLMPHIHPLTFLAIYGSSGVIASAVIAIIYHLIILH